MDAQQAYNRHVGLPFTVIDLSIIEAEIFTGNWTHVSAEEAYRKETIAELWQSALIAADSTADGYKGTDTNEAVLAAQQVRNEAARRVAAALRILTIGE